MEEIKIWAVDDGGAVPMQQADAMVSESLLERTLVSHPELLVPGLKLVGRQTPTEGGPLDLLGVDDEGRLVVFELKRGTLSRDAVAQVIDYASSLDSLNDDALSRHIADNSGRGGIDKIDDFQEWYGGNGQGDGLESLRPIRMVLVGLGVDDRTERMVRFLANNSRLDISLLTFYGFDHEGKTLLARQVRVTGDDRPVDGPSKRKVDSEEKRIQLIGRAEKHGVSALFDEVNQSFRKLWNGPSEKANNLGLVFRLYTQYRPGKSGWRDYARVDPENGLVRVVFFGIAVQLCPERFSEPIKDIPFDTWPRARENDPFASPDTEIQFKLTAQDWEKYKNTVNELSLAVHEALQEKDGRGHSAVLEAEHSDQFGTDLTP